MFKDTLSIICTNTNISFKQAAKKQRTEKVIK